MDQLYLREVISKIERMKAVHSEKFSDNPKHEDCEQRFDKVITNLSGDLEEKPRLDFSVSQSALPDAIEPARKLEEAAEELEKQCDPSAQPLRQRSREIVMKELNELDGFDR